MNPLVVIKSFRDPYLAHLAKAKLESEGIRAFLQNEYTIGIQWLYSNALGGVKLEVPQAEAEEAIKILETDFSDITIETLSEKSHVDKCPKCGSEDIIFLDTQRKAGALSLLFGIPLIFFGKKYKCSSCGNKWR